tara:strand:- start:101 stop:484 length:384 start_codon:yes stop_codon:yes gene_type:complete
MSSNADPSSATAPTQVQATPRMSGIGKGKGSIGKGKLLGKFAKRHGRKSTKPAIETVTRPVMRRFARRGGCKMVRSCVYDQTREVIHKKLTEVITDAMEYVKHGRRKRVKSIDVLAALNRRGHKLYR